MANRNSEKTMLQQNTSCEPPKGWKKFSFRMAAFSLKKLFPLIQYSVLGEFYENIAISTVFIGHLLSLRR